MYTIKIFEENGELKKEASCDGFVICAFGEKKEIAGKICSASAEVMACDISIVDIMTVMLSDGSPLNDAYEALLEMKKTGERLGIWKKLFGKK